MTRENHLKLIQRADLSKANIIYNQYDIRNDLMDLKAYYFEDLEGYIEYIIALDDKPIAGIMIYSIFDIQADILKEYQGRHIISGFFKYTDWKRNLPNDFEGEVSIVIDAIESLEDLKMKIYLINNIMKLRISNLDQLFDRVSKGLIRNEVD